MTELAAPQLDVDLLILGSAALLLVGAVATGLAERARIPSLVIFLGLGMLVADDGLALVRFDDAELARNLAVVALTIILFEGGLSTSWSRLRPRLAPAGALATVGVVLTAGLVAVAAAVILDLDATTALLLGAVISSTDAAAVFAVLRRAPVQGRLRDTLEAESGLNDPMAILLTIGLVAASTTDLQATDWFWFGARQLLLGLAVGLAIGVAAATALRRLPLPTSALRPVVAAAFGQAAYALGALAGASGFLAVYVCGIVIANLDPRDRRAIRLFHETLASMAQMGLFFLLGILVFPSQLPAVALRAAAVAVVLLLVARPLAVAACLLPLRWRVREITFVAWGGLRGAVPIVLATFPLTAGDPDGALVFDVVFFVVLLSAVVQGPTLVPLARRLGLHARGRPADLVAELNPVDGIDADLVEVQVLASCPAVRGPLREHPPPAGARILLVVRERSSFVPDGATVLTEGDHLVISGPAGGIDPRAVERWLLGQGPPGGSETAPP
jgi:potassium/hydrogen antiporter